MDPFNLVDEPWIPCLLSSGDRRDLGLRDTLIRAREVREIYDPSPLVTVALHRLLLAILHRTFGPATFAAWKTLWQAGRGDASALDRYFSKKRHLFNLFDPERPFYQVPFMDGVAQGPVQRLAQEAATGNNPTLFDHSYTSRPVPVPAAQAARWLLATQAFAIGGGVSKPFNLMDAPLARGYTVLVQGENLFETLALNLIPPPSTVLASAENLPAWEQDHPSVPDKEGTPERGYVDYLTWQSRRIHLVPDPDGRTVTFCQVQQNLKPRPGLLDPFKPYRRDKQGGYIPMRLDPGRAVWRDTHALLQFTDPADKRPEVLEHLAGIQEEREMGALEARPAYRLSILGLATEPGKATAIFWTHEKLPLPLQYLADALLLDHLQHALTLAEETARVLANSARYFGQLLVRGEKDPAAKQVADHISPAQLYWSRLEAPFRELLSGLPANPEAARDRWAARLRQTAVESFRLALQGMDQTARMLRAAALAERFFFKQLVPLFPQSEGGSVHEPAV